jgi:hypothetical protein
LFNSLHSETEEKITPEESFKGIDFDEVMNSKESTQKFDLISDEKNE